MEMHDHAASSCPGINLIKHLLDRQNTVFFLYFDFSLPKVWGSRQAGGAALPRMVTLLQIMAIIL